MNPDPPPPTEASIDDSREVVVYTRPGCPFCYSLRSGLRRAGLVHREIDIWDDPDAAAFVRSVANGNETVPTVVIGNNHLVNPTARRVCELAGHDWVPQSRARTRWFRRRRSGRST